MSEPVELELYGAPDNAGLYGSTVGVAEALVGYQRAPAVILGVEAVVDVVMDVGAIVPTRVVTGIEAVVDVVMDVGTISTGSGISGIEAVVDVVMDVGAVFDPVTGIEAVVDVVMDVGAIVPTAVVTGIEAVVDVVMDVGAIVVTTTTSPDVELVVVDYLRRSGSRVADLVGTRVYTTVPRSAEFPLLRVVRAGGGPVHDRPYHLEAATLQLDAYGGSKADARRLFDTALAELADIAQETHVGAVVTAARIGLSGYRPEADYNPPKPCYSGDVTVLIHP